jgi:cytoplasmic iron level regulating protein YaaA (DUF328/UPF0246 family)
VTIGKDGLRRTRTARQGASVTSVYVLLPPSETKQPGGDGPALDLNTLRFPELTGTRSQLLGAIAELSADLPAARAALKITAAQDDAVEQNGRVLTAPTMPALFRYTGVLYAALHTPKLSKIETARAAGRIVITSALFGLVAGADPIPAYRLSAGSRLPQLGTIASLWRPVMNAALAALDAPVLDLRSGAYAAFAPAPGAITVRVVTHTGAGEVKPVSHDNKTIKGELARLVASTRGHIDTPAKLVALASRNGLTVRRTGPASIDLIAPARR